MTHTHTVHSSSSAPLPKDVQQPHSTINKPTFLEEVHPSPEREIFTQLTGHQPVTAAYTKGLPWNIKKWNLTYMVSQLLNEGSKYTEDAVPFQYAVYIYIYISLNTLST